MSKWPPFLAHTKHSEVRDLVSAKGFQPIFLESAYSPTPSEWTYYIGTSQHSETLVIYISLVTINISTVNILYHQNV